MLINWKIGRSTVNTHVSNKPGIPDSQIRSCHPPVRITKGSCWGLLRCWSHPESLPSSSEKRESTASLSWASCRQQPSQLTWKRAGDDRSYLASKGTHTSPATLYSQLCPDSYDNAMITMPGNYIKNSFYGKPSIH